MDYARLLGYAAVVILWTMILRYSQRRRQPAETKRPPSPKSALPFLGHVNQIPPYHSWLKFKTWTDSLGPIVRFRIFGRENIVVSTEKIANDLLRERGSLYSSREPLAMASGFLSDNLRPLLMGYTDRWRRGRKLMHRLTMAGAANSYQPMQSLESKRMLYDLIKTPSQYELWFERYAGGLIFRLGYGKAINTGEEEHVRKALHVVHTVERVASPGSYLVDSLTLLKYLPDWLAPFKKEGRLLHDAELSFFRTLVSDVRAEIDAGVAGPSFVRTWLEDKKSYRLTDDEAAYVIGTLFEAGSGTTASALMSFVLVLVLFPQWQQAMWDELDEVVGDRMPEFEDVPNLPMCRAVIKEVLRWRPVTAGGVPHQLIQDDLYNGYFLPKGTSVHANQWAIHRDPELYPDPEKFNPDRWLNASYPTYKEPLAKYPSLQNFSAFGFGRRICPGMNIAERSLYIVPPRVAWACRITKAKDNDGNDITPPLYDYTPGFNTQPKPFPFHLEARSEKRRLAVEEAWMEAQASDPLAWTADYKLGHSLSE